MKRSLEILHQFFGPKETIRIWLNTPHPDLDGNTALETILTGRVFAVSRILEECVEWCAALMLPSPELPAALVKLRLVTIHGPWWRTVAFRYLLAKPAQPLYAAGSKMSGARFTPKGSFDSLYLAGDPVTALAEVSGLVMLPAGPHPVPTPPCTSFAPSMESSAG